MKNKPSLSPIDTNVLFSEMTRDELRRVATVLKVNRGANKSQLIQNLMLAVNDGRAETKFLAQINIVRSSAGLTTRIPIFFKDLTTYQAG